MEWHLQIVMNPNLYLRDPESTDLGRKILRKSVEMISKMGFEEFTFKKLAHAIDSTEAGIYRYFENKHRLLLYITAWYWRWVECQVLFHTQNMKNPQKKIETILRILIQDFEDKLDTHPHINKDYLHRIVLADSAKSFLTHEVDKDNKSMFFKPYKDLCKLLALVISEADPKCKYPHSVASSVLELSHLQVYFMQHLPSLTDFSDKKDKKEVYQFLRKLVFSFIA